MPKAANETEKPPNWRFWAKVDKGAGEDACWEWTACIFASAGYGAFTYGGKLQGAHRVAFQIAVGPIPYGTLVCHKCDNRKCVRPSHLFIGTYAENYRDAREKGRNTRGEKQGSAILTEQDVLAILNLRRDGLVYREIASRFNTDLSNVALICRGKSWKHVSRET